MSIPATVEIKRGRFIGLVAAVAVAAAAVTWILVAYAFDNGSSTATPSTVQARAIVNPLPPASLHARVVAAPIRHSPRRPTAAASRRSCR